MQTLQQLQSGELIGATKLKLSCGLTEFPRDILELADTLEYLDLSGNNLSALPADFSRLKKIKIAFFSDNPFTEIPEVLGALPKLEMLGFKANQIEVIPENSLAPTLRWLILTNNRIEKLPKSIGNCKNMQKLMLAGNKLQELPIELAACKKLELLRVSANELTEIPDWLFKLPHLSWLAFARNPCVKQEKLPDNLPEISWKVLELEEQLGAGASGVISKANWQKTVAEKAEKVAVKVFKGEVTSDGLPADEMQACMAAGKHPNLVQVLGKISDHPEQKQGLVLKLIPNGFKNLGNPPSFESCTRDTYLEGTEISWQAILNIISGIAFAAAQLHERGMMHGDLYAHNILIDENSFPLFGDFGAATIYDKEDLFAATFEKLEVRAFGCLLEELLDRLVDKNSDRKTVTKLLRLKQDCMQEHISERPDFATICKQLQSLVRVNIPA